MNYTNLIDRCQTHFAVQYPSNIKLIRQKWYLCYEWQPVARAKQASCLLHWLSLTYFARDPKYPWFHDHYKNWIHFLNTCIYNGPSLVNCNKPGGRIHKCIKVTSADSLWKQIRPGITSGLIWIQSDGIPEIIFRQKLILKKLADGKKTWKISRGAKGSGIPHP